MQNHHSFHHYSNKRLIKEELASMADKLLMDGHSLDEVHGQCWSYLAIRCPALVTEINVAGIVNQSYKDLNG